MITSPSGLSLLLLPLLALQAAAICCPWHPTPDLKLACDDGGLVHPWECCSTGACNVFCCNCGGPCRTNESSPFFEEMEEEEDWSFLSAAKSWLPSVQMIGRKKRHIQEALTKFQQLDSDGDNHLDMEEVMRYVSPGADLTGQDLHFDDLDLDQDGYISMGEFDEDLL